MNYKIILLVFLFALFGQLRISAQTTYTFNTMKAGLVTVNCEGKIIISDSTISILPCKKLNNTFYEIISKDADQFSETYNLRLIHKRRDQQIQMVFDFSKNLITWKMSNRKNNLVYFYTVN